LTVILGCNRGVLLHREECRDHTWVELAPGCPRDLRNRLLDRPRRLVRSIVGERIKYISHGYYAADPWDRFFG
jgi:hypothetical protein